MKLLILGFLLVLIPEQITKSLNFYIRNIKNQT